MVMNTLMSSLHVTESLLVWSSAVRTFTLFENRGFAYIPNLNFKTCHLMYWEGGHATVSILLLYLCYSLSLSQFWPIFVSFVAIQSAVVNVAVSKSCRLSELNPKRASCLGEPQIQKVRGIGVLVFFDSFRKQSSSFMHQCRFLGIVPMRCSEQCHIFSLP